MRNKPFIVMLVTLILASLACSMPGLLPASQPISSDDSMATIAAYAAQTLAAQPSNTPLATSQPGAFSTQAAAAATGSALTVQATQAALSALATSQAANQAQAGAAAQATAAAAAAGQAAQATAYAYSATATALAFPPPPPPPPVIPPSGPSYPPTGRIRFAGGATSANVDGTLKKGAAADYLINAGARQYMLANIYSPNNDVYLGVTSPDGTPLMRTVVGQTTFASLLPAGGDYRLTAASPSEKSNYTLQVIIPARIQFQPGAVSASVPGYLAGGQVNFYLAWAQAGQRMTVQINSPHSDIFLTVYGLEDGSPLVRSVMGQTSWSDVLPRTQDYMIQAVSTGGNANYTLQITIQ